MTLLNRLIPEEVRLAPMNFTRQPVMPRFWTGGVLAMFPGFLLGFVLLMQQHGVFNLSDYFTDLRLIHARVQIFLFTGSFLLGFAFQAGPHVLAGSPPSSFAAFRALYPLWLGFFLTLIPSQPVAWLGIVAISTSYLMSTRLVLRMARGGDPQRFLGIGLPITMGFLFLALGIWAPVGDSGHALWVIWCGPIAVVFGASQQLISNVMGGRRLDGMVGRVFIILLAISWLLSLRAAFQPGIIPLMGFSWLLVCLWFIWHTKILPAMFNQGFASLTIALACGLSLIPLAAIVLMVQGSSGLDVVVHLLGAGTITLLIIGVTSRVAAFFSAGRLFHDRVASLLLVGWMAVALGRAFGFIDVMELVVMGGGLLAFWGVRLLIRLWAIRALVPVRFGGRKGG